MKSILCNIVSRHPSGVAIILAVAVAMAAGGCSTRKNTAASRNYQAFITRYNVYFNGDQHYKETLKEMESVYEDDYSGPYILHPAEAYNVPAAPQPTGSFTRSIEKAQKAIQLHSIKKRPRRTPGRRNDPEYRKWLKREEYNPFLHNAWMMMGRSQYMNGDFLGAAATFYYVSRHFSWLDATVTEARLWEARCYCALDWLYEAEVIISRISDSKLESKLLRELHSFVSADFYVRSHMYDRAIPHLSEAARMASKPQKTRLYFILGRVCAEAGRKKEAYQAYRKAGSGVGASYRARFNARIKQSEVYDGAAIASEVNALRRLTRYGSNRDYLDQIYYAIANLYLSRGDTVNAITNYELAAERSTRNGIDKAISQATLGGLYYDLGQYDKAQFCYSEAVPQLPDTYPGYAGMKRRSDLLDELAVYTQNVTLNDSLLRLAEMPESERLTVVNGIISRLVRKEQEEAENARREEYIAAREAAGEQMEISGSMAPQEFSLSTDRSWYSEYYLRQIPLSDVQKVTANDVIQDGLYNSGLILKDKMEDYPAAHKMWDRLLTRYPDNVYRLDVYNNLYLMYMRMGQEEIAEQFRLKIISDFPDSRYAEAMSDPAYISRVRGMVAEQESIYEQAYADYLSDRNLYVHRAYEKMAEDYPLSPLMPKFMFLHALAYVTEDRPAEFNEVLKTIIERYPDADIAPLAASWHKGMNEGRRLRSSGTNARGMLLEIRLSNDSVALALGESGKIEFRLDPGEPHYLVLLFSTDSLSPNQLLYDVARHNFSTYVVRDFDLEVMNFGRLGMLIVKGFVNQAELNHYRALLARDVAFSMPSEVRPVEIGKSNFEQLLKGAGSFDDYFRFIGEETVRDTHETVLPSDIYPSSSEMYPPDTVFSDMEPDDAEAEQ